MERKREDHYAEWLEDYTAWKRSGLSTKQYCSDKPYKAGAFAKRNETLKRKGYFKETGSHSPFIPLAVKAPPMQTKKPFCTISFEESGDIIIEKAESMGCLGKLLQAMRGV